MDIRPSKGRNCVCQGERDLGGTDVDLAVDTTQQEFYQFGGGELAVAVWFCVNHVLKILFYQTEVQPLFVE